MTKPRPELNNKQENTTHYNTRSELEQETRSELNYKRKQDKGKGY
jgi:hypothetical protein